MCIIIHPFADVYTQFSIRTLQSFHSLIIMPLPLKDVAQRRAQGIAGIGGSSSTTTATTASTASSTAGMSMARRSASLRQTRTIQYSLEMPSGSASHVPNYIHSNATTSSMASTPTMNAHYGVGTAAMASSSSSSHNYGNTTGAKKSNWEVIEHFSTTSKGRGSVSSSLIAVSKLRRSERRPSPTPASGAA